MISHLLASLPALCTLLFVSAALAAPKEVPKKDAAAVERTFASMEKAWRGADEALFQRQWHQEGYQRNLVGGGGISGKDEFAQGVRKGWYLKPALDKMIAAGPGAFIVPCEVWSFKENRALDAIHALLVRAKDDNRWVMLGGGEKQAEVQALASRFLNREPLAPPPK